MKTRLAMCFLLAAPLACSDNNLADDGSGGAGGAATASGSAGSGGGAGGPGGSSLPGGAGTTGAAGLGGGAGAPGGGGNGGNSGGSCGMSGGGRCGSTAGSGGSTNGGSGGAGGVRLDGGASDAGTRDSGADVNLADICGVAGACSAIEREWNDAVRKDQACSPGISQCATQVNGIGCGGCPVLVNGTVNTDAVRKKWQDAGCARCIRICPAILCVAPGRGVCEPVAMGGAAVIGQCVMGRGLPPN